MEELEVMTDRIRTGVLVIVAIVLIGFSVAIMLSGCTTIRAIENVDK